MSRMSVSVEGQRPDSTQPDFVTDTNADVNLDILTHVNNYRDNIVMVRIREAAVLVDIKQLHRAVASMYDYLE